MLKNLRIENYALIEKLDINFGEGLTVITGETGAGKSILLGALSLILGQRADVLVLNDNSKKCIIEGQFDISTLGLETLLMSYELDYDDLSVFRREITPQGKSRAFVNDTPVTLPILKEISSKIIDIHSQHQNLLIGESSFQFDVIDSFSGNLSLVNHYRSEYQELLKRRRDLHMLEEQEHQSKKDLDYYLFQHEELNKAALDTEQYQELVSEMEQIRNSEEINNKLHQTYILMSGGEMNLLEMLHDALLNIRSIAKYSEQYRNIEERINSVFIELKDISRDIDNYREEGPRDPGKAAEIELKLDFINKLLLKHQVSDMPALILVRDDYKGKISTIESLEKKIDSERKIVAEMEGRLLASARNISIVRKNNIAEIEKEILRLLKELGMPGASISILLEQSGKLSSNGIDRVKFVFSANSGGEMRDISYVASGGELSRLMLCVKSLISQKNLLPSIIFDEIDTGISGEIGGKIAAIMKTISENMQVIAITHLPQIAATGKEHLLVHKTIENGKTRTMIKALDKDQRIHEIATMLGGSKPTVSMVRSAEELLNLER
jgi:DNA repair protein RecN (Recombination protein N)